MDCRCAYALPIVTGWGPPVAPHDPEESSPIYLDLESRRIWVATGGAWLPVRAPLSWADAPAQDTLAAGDFVIVNRGGAPGHPDAGDYLVATVAQVLGLAQRVLGLGDLSDVTIDLPGNGQVLAYDGTAWTNDAIRLFLSELQDVSVDTPEAGQVLTWSGTAWQAQRVQRKLGDLADVALSAARDGEALQHVDGAWRNRRPTTRLGALADVDVSAAMARDVLVFDGQAWSGLGAWGGESAWCVGCREDLPEDLPDGMPVVIAGESVEAWRWRGGKLVPLAASLLVCVNTGAVYVRTDGRWRRAELRRRGAALVLQVVEAASLADAEAAGLVPGRFWLDVSVTPPVLRLMVAPGQVQTSPLQPQALVAVNTHRLWVGRCDSDGRFVIGRARLDAGQVCVASCGDAVLPGTVQDLLCGVSATGALPDVGPCASGTVITQEMRFEDALCLLDAALRQLNDRVQTRDVRVRACPQGPVDRDMSLQDAVCRLSESVDDAGSLTLPVPARRVRVTACSQGVVSSDMDLQSAICAMSAAAGTATVSVNAADVPVDPCALGSVPTGWSLQTALCNLADLPGRRRSMNDYDRPATIGGVSGLVSGTRYIDAPFRSVTGGCSDQIGFGADYETYTHPAGDNVFRITRLGRYLLIIHMAIYVPTPDLEVSFEMGAYRVGDTSPFVSTPSLTKAGARAYTFRADVMNVHLATIVNVDAAPFDFTVNITDSADIDYGGRNKTAGFVMAMALTGR